MEPYGTDSGRVRMLAKSVSMSLWFTLDTPSQIVLEISKMFEMGPRISSRTFVASLSDRITTLLMSSIDVPIFTSMLLTESTRSFRFEKPPDTPESILPSTLLAESTRSFRFEKPAPTVTPRFETADPTPVTSDTMLDTAPSTASRTVSISALAASLIWIVRPEE